MEFINIKFHYNGNLGILQQKTIDSKIFCGKLLQNGVITRDERKVLMEKICDYFMQEIEKVVESSYSYTDTL